MEFKELSKKNINEVESDLLKEWKSVDILKKTIDHREGCDNFVFYDGPIYANAKPGIHHVFAKTIKDSFCKYKTMQGYKVDRKIGLDCNGLPIEYNVEKKLGINGKKDIEEFGIDKFIEECKKNTAINIDEVNKVTDMMGQFIDCEHPYVTCVNDYHETEWYLLKEMHKKGLIYHSNKILPYCPRCGTELAKFEVDQGYQDVSVNTVIVPFKIVDKDEYLLVWTTTPWTLMDNVAACVNPDYDYIKVESMGYKFILGKSLASKVLGDDYTLLETFKGSDLVGTRYEQLMPFAKVEDGDSFKVVADSYVTDADGTGIVHIAPAYGEDDNRVCKENGIGWTQSVGLDGKYTIGPWAGRLVTDSELEIDIIKWLKSEDKLFKKIKITHPYPHCWRCKSPLIYYAKPAWYINTTSMKEEIIAENNKIEWYPSYVGEKRFGNWLDNMVDWGISRNRYWGCPLPFWVCDECGEFDVIGSREELIERADQDIKFDDIDMHRPYVDSITMKCPHCGKTMHRVKDVIDVWFDSGAMPYAQCHYPFENKDWFDAHFPADFIAEGVDQTRGWFYTLLVISTLISGKSSYKRVVVNDMMLDAHGKKMSKSIGNIIEPIGIMSKYGADTIRWYMLYASPVWTPLKFDEEGVKEIYSKYISTLKNTYSFFQMYANADHVDPREYNIPVREREDIDKWLISKLNKLVRDVTLAFEEYDLNRVTRLVIPFLNDDLSNWYIRSTRRRFWESELTNSKKAVYLTTYEVLETLCRLCAPITPFITEEIYKNLTGEESVHLADYPKYDESLIDLELEEKMDLVRDVCSLGRFAREDVKIKVRQPISEVLLDNGIKSKIVEFEPVIMEELNVKNITYIDNMTDYLDYVIKPNFREVGKMFGSNVGEFTKLLGTLSVKEIETLKNESVHVEFMGEDLEITPSMVIITVNVKEGYCSSNNGKVFVILNTELTEDLILEGLAREFVRKVQSLRKDNDYVITDRINVYYDGNDMLEKTIDKYNKYIKNETLAVELIKDSSLVEECDMNGISVKVKTERI